MADEDFTPKSRQDWVDLFRDGTLSAIAADREADAKAKQQGADADKDKDKDAPKKRSLADILMGNKD